ncbi:MAG: hypothetical protein ACYCYE_13360 [Clostridia bacterium]
MQRCYKNLRSKGSITVEACITLPVFLSVFFLLLFLVKFTCTGMVLDYAVNEAAKEIASAAYPISFINELEDEKISEYENVKIPTLEEELERLGQKIGGDYGSIIDILISRDYKEVDIADALGNVLEDYSKGIAGGLLERITPAYWDMKSAGKYMIADVLVKEHLSNPIIKNENARLRLVVFPQGKAEYDAKSEVEAYKSFGLIPGKDFDSDDVVVQLEYDYRVKLPFVEALNVKMVHTAVERAWINGSFGILTAKEEGLDFEPEGSIVFITRTGIRFHRGSCWYLRKSRMPIGIGEAEGKGYTPCKVCKPLD